MVVVVVIYSKNLGGIELGFNSQSSFVCLCCLGMRRLATMGNQVMVVAAMGNRLHLTLTVLGPARSSQPRSPARGAHPFCVRFLHLVVGLFHDKKLIILKTCAGL